MKRIILKLTAALVMAVMMMAVAAPAFATIHPISSSEGSQAPSDTPAQTQNPPGITIEGHEPGYTDPDPDNAVEAQPLVSHLENKTDNDTTHAWKPEKE